MAKEKFERTKPHVNVGRILLGFGLIAGVCLGAFLLFLVFRIAAAPDASPTVEPTSIAATLTPLPESDQTATPGSDAVTPSPQSGAPMVMVGVDTNCRVGPGPPYASVGGLLVGEKAEVVGRGPNGQYVIIRNPDGGPDCWLWGNYATPSGDLSGLPVATLPPTPTFTPTATPAGPDFTFTFNGIVNCSPGDSYAQFQFTNTGGVYFESILMHVVDQDASSSLYGPAHSNLPFHPSGDGCHAGNDNLAPGNQALNSYYIGSPHPAGHAASATARLCTENDVGGECVEKTINFTLP